MATKDRPTATPTEICLAERPITSRITRCGLAPRAARIPTPRRRCITFTEIRAKTPALQSRRRVQDNLPPGPRDPLSPRSQTQ